MSTQVESAPAESVDEGPKTVVETQSLTKVYRDFWGRQKVRALKA